MRKIINKIREFWEQVPGLHAGICATLGIGCAVEWSWGLVSPLLLVCMRGWRTAAFVLIAFGYGWWQCPAVETMEGVAELHIENLKLQPSPFHQSYQYRAMIKRFEGKKCNLPCSIYVPHRKNRPVANKDYRLKGRIMKRGAAVFVFKPDKGAIWEKMEGTWSLAEWRFQTKEKLRKFLKKQIPDKKSASFLTALATGDVQDRTLSLEFGRLGLQHILAISGFHFALIAAFIGIFLRLFFKPKYASAALLILLTAYFFFMGNAPSVLRAWIGISLFLIGQLFQLRTSPLNILGIALLIELLSYPLLIVNIGFQLSFLATLAILLLYPLFDKCCQRLLQKRALAEVSMMNRLHQHLYLVGAVLRQLVSLNIAVHAATLPVLLFLFQKFPLLSLGYNLFFPLGASLALLLLCAGCLFSLFFPPLGSLLHKVNSAFTAALLKTTEQPPAFLDYSLRTNLFALPVLYVFLTLLFFAGIYFTKKAGEI